ncbi:MAG: FAD-dependent oxidoreductase [Kiritimatiellaeota bacterium]|nr:FAD-dependent oxidoreductase [Kiritimatiellota bacterium]
MLDVWRALVGARRAMPPRAYDVGPFIQTRERRRIVGDHVLTYLDQIAGRTYPDSIVFSASDYDSHGYPNHSYFALMPHDGRSLTANHPAPGGACFTPYRCLLPRGLDGILVTGLGISMERDASALVRMQRDMHNQGYAAGAAAAMAALTGRGPREIDIRALQRELVALGALPEDVLQHNDSFPLPAERVRAAVRDLAHPDRRRASVALAIVLSHRVRAADELRAAFRDSVGGNRLTYARILGFFGEREVVDTLTAALDQVAKWDAKVFQGVMAEYAHLPTPVDSLILALGHTRDPRAVPAILRKLEKLDASVTLSHHRAVALALERIGDPTAAEPIARLLAQPGMRGHTLRRLVPLHDKPVGERRRIGALREIVWARALYRCGDSCGLGKRILEEYERDQRGLFARHARFVLRCCEFAPPGLPVTLQCSRVGTLQNEPPPPC